MFFSEVQNPQWGRTVQYLLRSGLKQAHGKDAGDHPPITPMRPATREEFTKGPEWRIYEYVTRHFIASLMADMEYTEKRHLFDLQGERFAAVTHKVTERGFLFALPWRTPHFLNETEIAPVPPLVERFDIEPFPDFSAK